MSEENLYPDEGREPSEEKKPEIVWEQGVQQGVYKEGAGQQRGEYHETPGMQSGMYQQNHEYWKNSAYQQNTFGQESYQPVSRGFGIASLVLGILSLVLFCSCINIPLAIMAVIFGVLQLVKPESPKGMAVAGIITSVLSIIAFAVFMITFVTSADFQKGFERGFQNGINEDFYEEFFNGYSSPDYDEDYNFFDDHDDGHNTF